MFQASWHLVIRTDWPGTSDSFNVCIDLMETSIKQVFHLLASAYPFPFTGIFFYSRQGRHNGGGQKSRQAKEDIETGRSYRGCNDSSCTKAPIPKRA